MNAAVGKLNANVSDLPSSSGLNSLRAAAASKDPAAIDATAKQFEGLFAQQLMKTMRDASGSDAMFPGDSKTYRDLYDREVANKLAQGKGLGMQAMLRKSLGGKAEAAASTPTPPPKNAGMSLAEYERFMPPQHVSSTPATPTPPPVKAAATPTNPVKPTA